jgi:CheY-like chemotaxis protein
MEMTSAEFTQHIRFALHHLFEISVLDKGPGQALACWLDNVSPASSESSYGQRLHQLLVQGIEQMVPEEPLDPNLPRHRSYLILKRRYLDGVSVQQLESEFNTSSRQFRRENHRAIEELVLSLWQLAPQPTAETSLPPPPPDHVEPHNKLVNFDRSASAIKLLDGVMDAAQTLAGIINATSTQVTADISPDLPPVNADRVALRLALIKLLRLAIAHSPEHMVRLSGTTQGESLLLTLDGVQGITGNDSVFVEAAQLFSLAEGTLTLSQAPTGQCITARLTIHHRPIVLVVDDDPAMPRIVQRFLALQPLTVVGCTSTDDVVKLARETQPVLILLDVLMPKRDGWEILQELKANPDTYHFQLAVCSIWDERELALSLGADMFFQKPIGRAELLACVEEHIAAATT